MQNRVHVEILRPLPGGPQDTISELKYMAQQVQATMYVVQGTRNQFHIEGCTPALIDAFNDYGYATRIVD